MSKYINDKTPLRPVPRSLTIVFSGMYRFSRAFTTIYGFHIHRGTYTKMSSTSKHSVSTPFLSTPASHPMDDSNSTIGSNRSSHSGLISSPSGPLPQQSDQEGGIKHRSAERPTVLQSWKWEFGSAILLLVSVAAIPATLYPYDGKPSPQWPYSISINALLSIYSMILKACLGFLVTSCIGQLQWSWYTGARPLRDIVLFHEAAHGILGSMKWLWVNHLRQPLTALGALITFVALAIDPFTQQLVQAIDCSEILSQGIPVSVPRTNYLRYDPEFPTGNLQAMILAGLDTFPNLTDFECSTGNCTFRNTYSSLSFCSRCSDRSSEVVVEEQCRVVSRASATDSAIYHQDTGPCNASKGERSPYIWNITTSWPPYYLNFCYQGQNVSGPSQSPEVFSIQSSDQQMNTVQSAQQFQESTQQLQFGVTLGYSDWALRRLRLDPISAVSVPLSGCDDFSTNDSWSCRGYGAASCVIQPCVRTYSCSIEAGRAEETTVEESNLDQIWGFNVPARDPFNGYTYPIFGLVDLQCITDADRGHLVQNGYDIDTTSRWLSYNVTFDPSTSFVNASSSFPESLLANDCLYIIDPNFLLDLQSRYLWPILVGPVTRTKPSDNIFDSHFVFTGKEQVVRLYNSGNVSMASVSEMFENLAQALTLWARSNGYARYSRRAEGDVIHYAVCVRVTWTWISLPAVLAGLSLLMLALTVTNTARTAVPVWKLFPLAVLLRGPAGDGWLDQDLLTATAGETDKTDIAEERSIDGMLGLASRVSVQLFEENGRYRLRQVGVRSKKV